jgi:hypothetical protein
MKALHESKVWIDTKDLSAGVYLIKIVDERSESYKRIVIE